MSVALRPQPYDAIVVGSGAAGGWAAKVLTERGWRVLILEAGDQVPAGFDALGRGWRLTAARIYRYGLARTQRTQGQHLAYWFRHPDLFVDDSQHPYSTPDSKPFSWIRGRQVGGRTLAWGGVTLRLSDHELRQPAEHGYGPGWPITGHDLAPYYAEAEAFMRVHGARDNLPQLPDGVFLPPKAMTPGERLLMASVESRWPDRRVVHCRGIAAGFTSGEPSSWPTHSSQATTLRAAFATGNLELRPNSIVSHVLVDPDTGRATGLGFVDRLTKEGHEVRGRVIVLCASTIESLRILLNSSSRQHPAGLGNSNGLLGRYFMDHPSTAFIGGVLEGLERPSQAEGLQGPHGILIPRFRNLDGQRAGFLGGYGIWGGAQRFDTARGFPTLAKHWAIGTPGLVWRRVRRSPARSARRLLGNERQSRDDAIVALRAYGEMIPRYENRVALSDEMEDAWGIPVARIECAWSDNELAMTRDMSRSILEIMDAVGVRVTLNREQAEAGTPLTPGLFAHELGGARMGADPRTSVVNPSNQLWDSPNVLVTDGACWPSGAWQNPALTIMALTARACALMAKDPLP